MVSVKALASYKKKEGILDISKDQKALVWTPSGATAPMVTILVSNIDRMFLNNYVSLE
jgi:hypothetical protein